MQIIKYLVIVLILSGCATRPWTKEEKILLTASCLATVADTVTTLDMLDNGNWEINPIMGKHPSDSKVVVTMGATQTLTIILAHYLEGFRSWILGVKTGINAGYTFHNLRIND